MRERSTPSSLKRTSTSSSTAAAATVAAAAPQHAGNDATGGVFLYVNGLLCRTADDSGAFRPCDVFAGPDRAPERSSLPLPSLQTDAADGEVLPDRPTGPVAFESDCPLFNIFGVVSGGVLVEPDGATFADMTQRALYTVGGRRSRGTAAVRAENDTAYRCGNFSAIRPEAALTLCASELPLPPTAPSTPEEVDAAARELRRRCPPPMAPPLPPRLVETLHARMAAPASTMSGEAVAACKATWVDAESLRRSLQADPVRRAKQPQPHFSVEMPFHYRDGGGPLHSGVQGGTDAADGTAPSVDDVAHAEAVFDAPPPGIRSAASSFVCYLGQPRFTLGTFRQKLDNLTAERQPPLVTRLQKRLRPYDLDAQDAPTPPPKPASSSPSNNNSVKEKGEEEAEELELFLTTDNTQWPRSVAFRLFNKYFFYFGLLCDGRRVTSEEALQYPTVLSPPPDPRKQTWELCADVDYAVGAEVRRKRRETKALWLDPASTFPGGGRWSTTASCFPVVSAAYTALLTTHRDALLQRLRHLHVYVRERTKHRRLRVL